MGLLILEENGCLGDTGKQIHVKGGRRFKYLAVWHQLQNPTVAENLDFVLMTENHKDH